MKGEISSIEGLIKGGILGAALGALLSKDKEEGAVIGALLGAAISATIKANDEAKKTNVSVYVEEDGQLFEISPEGQKRFVKKLNKPSAKFPHQFKLD